MDSKPEKRRSRRDGGGPARKKHRMVAAAAARDSDAGATAMVSPITPTPPLRDGDDDDEGQEGAYVTPLVLPVALPRTRETGAAVAAPASAAPPRLPLRRVSLTPPPSLPLQEAAASSPATKPSVRGGTNTAHGVDGRGARGDLARALPYLRNDIRAALLQNDPVEPFLHVVMVISNPCLYRRRYELAHQFIARMEREPHVLLYIVELAYDDQVFEVTRADHPRHLQLRTATAPLWHKENMLNIGIERLLPPTWRAAAWIDADVEFENGHWALDVLRVLNGCRDVVQVFSHALDMDYHENTMTAFAGFGYMYARQRAFPGAVTAAIAPEPGAATPKKGAAVSGSAKGSLNEWHTGYGWAFTRRAYEQMGGLFERAVLGGGDKVMAMACLGHVLRATDDDVSDAYKAALVDFQDRCHTPAPLRIGYVPGVIRHYFHGAKADRRYKQRRDGLRQYAYDPERHVQRDPATHLLVPTRVCPAGFLQFIRDYFAQRNEDSRE